MQARLLKGCQVYRTSVWRRMQPTSLISLCIALQRACKLLPCGSAHRSAERWDACMCLQLATVPNYNVAPGQGPASRSTPCCSRCLPKVITERSLRKPECINVWAASARQLSSRDDWHQQSALAIRPAPYGAAGAVDVLADITALKQIDL